MDGLTSMCSECAAASVFGGKAMFAVACAAFCASTPLCASVLATPAGSTGKLSSSASDSASVMAEAVSVAVPTCEARSRHSTVASPLLATVTLCCEPLTVSSPSTLSDSVACFAVSR